ncbi:hypothetical protein [Oceanospirillum phage vB_OliS_GJ44]|nr:hypothetical protein [Oceanospirillum phage vB_OliS_GJ44]
MAFINPKTDEDIAAEQAEAHKQIRINEIHARFSAIELESARPMRAIKVAELEGGQADSYDIQKIKDLEAEAVTLRQELLTLL